MRHASRLHTSLFSFRDDHGRGRCVMLASAIITGINSWLTTDIFYTSFLMIYGIDLVNLGIITFIPYIASCFGVFSPSLLERFSRRRWVLVGGKLLYYTLNILGITLVPVLVTDQGTRLVYFAVIIFLANLINALIGSGFSIWHLNFIPDSIRADFFLKQSTISGFVGIGISLISGVVADLLSASPYANTIIILFRYVAYGLALIDVAVLSLPKEYPYQRSHDRPRLKDIVTMPLGSKPFMMTMLVIVLHTFFNNVPASFVNYYLLNDVGMRFTYINVINLVYPFTLLLLQPIARRLINHFGWFKVLAVSMLLHAPSWIAYACVNGSNYLWLYTATRLFQHVIGVGLNTAYSNIAYVNLPPRDQTNYFSFYQLAANLTAFVAMMLGTGLVALIGDWTPVILGISFPSVQLLMLLRAAGNLIVPMVIFSRFHMLDPQARADVEAKRA